MEMNKEMLSKVLSFTPIMGRIGQPPLMCPNYHLIQKIFLDSESLFTTRQGIKRTLEFLDDNTSLTQLSPPLDDYPTKILQVTECAMIKKRRKSKALPGFQVTWEKTMKIFQNQIGPQWGQPNFGVPYI